MQLNCDQRELSIKDMRLGNSNGENRKVLVLAYQFPPDGGSVQRVTRFVQYLPDLGWNPIVITRRMEKASEEVQELLDLLERRAKIIRVGPFPLWRQLLVRMAGFGQRQPIASQCLTVQSTDSRRPMRISGLLRSMLRSTYRTLREWFVWPDSAIWWLPSAFAAAIFQIASNRIDAIYVVSPPHSVHLLGIMLRRLTGVRLVADYRDPWATDMDIVTPTHLHRRAHVWAERICLRNADAVITTTDYHSDYVRTQIGEEAAHRVCTITNGYDAAAMENLPEYDGTHFEIVYAGAFAATRRLTPLLSAVQLLRDREPETFAHVSIRVIGKPNRLLESNVQAYGLSQKVRFQSHLPYRQVMRELSQSAVLLLVVHSDEYIAKTCIPAKLFEYLATPRPILAISPAGAAAALVEKFKAGVVLHPEDIEGIAQAVTEFYRQYRAGRLVRHGSPEDIQRFERRSLTESLSRILETPTVN
jgi:glycosyltransferase involved in cell wall biosynthesis